MDIKERISGIKDKRIEVTKELRKMEIKFLLDYRKPDCDAHRIPTLYGDAQLRRRLWDSGEQTKKQRRHSLDRKSLWSRG